MSKKKENTGLVNGLRLVNGIYHYRFSWKNEIQSGSCKTGNKREAENYRDEIKSRMRNHDIDIRAIKKATFQEVYEKYIQSNEPRLAESTVGAIKGNFENHWAAFAKTKIEDMQDELDKLYNVLKNKKKVCKGSQKLILARLRVILEFGRKRGLHNVPLEYQVIDVPRDPKQTLNDEQMMIFFEYLHELGSVDQIIIVSSLFYLGMRISEATHLSWDNLDEQNKTYRIDKQKNKKITLQPVPNEMMEVFALKPRKPGEWICPSRSEVHNKNFTSRLLYEISKLMGLKQLLTHHRLRASFITNIQRNGCSLAIATKLARHSNPAITLAVYTEASMEDLRNGLSIGLGKIPKVQIPPETKTEETPVG